MRGAGNKASAAPPRRLCSRPATKPIRSGGEPRAGAAAARAFFEQHFTAPPRRAQGPARPAHRLLRAADRWLAHADREISDPDLPAPARPREPGRRDRRGAKADALTHARKTDNGVVPYATRAEIEQGALNGQGLELLYLADPVDVFFMQIQGSGRIRLPDGTTIRVSYDGKNGHPYTSIGRYLIDNGQLSGRQDVARGARRLAEGRSGARPAVMWQNASYVFFRSSRARRPRARSACCTFH